MKESRPASRGLTAMDAALALIVVLLIIQVWLLTATLESYLAGHNAVVLTGLVASAVLVLGCVGLYGFVRRIDREVRRRP